MQDEPNLYESLFYGNPSVMLVIDSSTGAIIKANDSACQYYGYPRSELCGKHICEIYALPRESVGLELSRAAEGIKSSIHFKHRLASGELRDVEVFSSAYRSGSETLVLSVIHDVTAQRRAEEAINQNESRFRSFVEHAPVPIGVWKLEGTCLYANQKYLEALGMKGVEEIIGHPATDFFAPQFREESQERTRRRLAGLPVPAEYEAIAQRADGIRFPVHLSVASIQLSDKTVSIAFMTDISESKRKEAALRESEEKYRLLHENAGIGTAYYRADGTVLSYNRVAAGNMNGQPEDFAGKSIYDLFPKAEAEHYHSRIKQACLAGEPATYDDLVLLPSGEKHFLSTFTKITNAENDILGIQVISQDITELKRSVSMLRESDSRFRSVFEQSSVGSVFVGFDKRFIKCNPAFCAFLGYGEDELIGKTISEVTYPDDAEIGMKELKLIAEGKLASFTGQKRYLRKDGTVVWGEVSISLVRDATGKPLYLLPIIKDVTDRIKAEEEHRKYEQQLQQSQKLESLGLLAGGIAHDFNNLLGGIYGYIDLAGDDSANEKFSRYLSKAKGTIERARGLTLQLLTFAKGGAPIKKAGSLFPFVRETAQFALSGSNVSCDFEIQQDLRLCDFDKNQIGQVIDNIIINAKQAMPMGGTIDISARDIVVAKNDRLPLGEGAYVAISIRDHGTGIPPDVLPRIFDPFYTTKQTGHGLGLATSFSIVKRHDGHIAVESAPGEGSTFHIYLPALGGSESPGAERPSATHSGRGVFLVMDDQEVMRDIIGDMVESLGYAAVRMKNGNEVIDFAISESGASREIAGMILDITIPGGMGGKEAIGEIRKIRPRVPILVSSGYAEDPIMANPRAYGFTASICKPFIKSELAETLNLCLESVVLPGT
jgi:PAS domain S-box-containing protein